MPTKSQPSVGSSRKSYRFSRLNVAAEYSRLRSNASGGELSAGSVDPPVKATGVASTRRHVFATMLALVPGAADVVKID